MRSNVKESGSCRNKFAFYRNCTAGSVFGSMMISVGRWQPKASDLAVAYCENWQRS